LERKFLIGFKTHDYLTKGKFVRELTQKENQYRNRVLAKVIKYSNQEQNYERVRQLNEVYELLFV
jgi:hypothetical protein